MERVELKKIITENGKIEYQYDVSRGIEKYFLTDAPFFIDYQLNDNFLSVSDVPGGILAIPFVTNILPVIWITDSELYVSELDEVFYESIAEFKRGYQEMYPFIHFKGKIFVDRVKHYDVTPLQKSAMFFSGGVDSWCTFIRHLSEDPDLMLIWGSDIPHTDNAGWETLRTLVKNISSENHCNLITIHSSFRTVLSETNLDKDFYEMFGDYWWHCMQHGIAIIGHAAPCNYLLGIQRQYIAASFSEEVKVVCASRPEIDNFVRFFNCDVIHDSYITRTEKTSIIANYHKESKKNIPLHVCWRTTDGYNCCKCEKCYRTIMGLLLEGEDPQEYGFDSRQYTLSALREYICNRVDFTHSVCEPHYWRQLQNTFRLNKEFLKNKAYYNDIKWIEDFEFGKCIL